MRIVIPGGSGQVGAILARAFADDDVTVIGRGGPVVWDGRTLGPWVDAIDGADVVINLAGRSVNCRYNEANRRAIMDSRVDSTCVIGEAIAQAANPPRVWLQSSTATIYAGRYDAPNDERTGIIGDGFSVDVAQAWERAAVESCPLATRLVLLRSAMVMSPDRGGVFDVMSWLARLGLGGSVAGGRQYVSWIHDQDFVRAVRFLIERDDLAGAVNLAAPGPLPQREFMRVLRSAWRMPVGLPATKWMAEIGAFAIRSDTELLLKSRRVVPRRLVDAGFSFGYPDWRSSAADLVPRHR